MMNFKMIVEQAQPKLVVKNKKSIAKERWNQ